MVNHNNYKTVIWLPECIRNDNNLCCCLMRVVGNEIGDEGGECIGTALKTNSSLQELYMGCKRKKTVSLIGGVENVMIGGNSIFIIFIVLLDCGMMEKGGRGIGEGLALNSSLKILDLYGKS